MNRRWLVITGLWVLLYPVPPLPFAPAFGYITAMLLGPPYTDGTTADGWPRIGEFTPTFVIATVGLPWIVTSLAVASVGVLISRRAARSGDAGPERPPLAGPPPGPQIQPATGDDVVGPGVFGHRVRTD